MRAAKVMSERLMHLGSSGERTFPHLLFIQLFSSNVIDVHFPAWPENGEIPVALLREVTLRSLRKTSGDLLTLASPYTHVHTRRPIYDKGRIALREKKQ